MSDPVASAPTTGHELLLGLAGWVDDDLLGIGRELVAVGEETVALELLTASVSAARTVLPHPVRDDLADAVERRLGPGFARLLPPGGPYPDGTAHLFVPDPPFAVPELVARIDAVVTELPVVARSRARTSLTWRLTPAGTSPGPVPHPVLLAVLDDPGPAEVLAYQLGAALARAGVPVSVESFVGNQPLPPYQRAALAASRPLGGSFPDPGIGAATLPVLPATAPVPDENLFTTVPAGDDTPDPALPDGDDAGDTAGDGTPGDADDRHRTDPHTIDRDRTAPHDTDRTGAEVHDVPGSDDRYGAAPGPSAAPEDAGHDGLAPDMSGDAVPDDDAPGPIPPGPVRMAPTPSEPGRIDPARIDPGRFDPARRAPNGVAGEPAGDDPGPRKEAVWTDPTDLPRRPRPDRPEPNGSERPGTPSPGPSDPRPGPVPGDRPYDGPNGHPAPRPAPRRPFRPLPHPGAGPSGPTGPPTGPNLIGPPSGSFPGVGPSDPPLGADLSGPPTGPGRSGPPPRPGPPGEAGPGADRPLTPPANGHGPPDRPPPGEQSWNQQWSTGSWAVAPGPLPGQDPDIEPATSPTPSTPPSGSFPSASPPPGRRPPAPGPSGTVFQEPDLREPGPESPRPHGPAAFGTGIPEAGLREPEQLTSDPDEDGIDPRPRHRLDVPDTDDEADATGSPGYPPAGPSPSAVPDYGLDSRLTPNEQELLRRLQEELAAREGGEPPSSPRNGRSYPGGDTP